MATQNKMNVGVVLINDLGLYGTEYFIPLQNIQGTRKDISFLITNVQYFNNTNSNLAPPSEPFDNNWRPPEYGKPLYLIRQNKVPAKLAKAYLDTYSMEGKFGKIADKGYMCAPDIDRICKFLTSSNPIIQRQALQILQRDKVVIDLTYSALEVSEDIKDPALRDKTVELIFRTIIDGLKCAPLSHQFDLPKIIVDRETRKKAAAGSEQAYADMMQAAVKSVFDEGKTCAYQQAQSRHN